MKNKILLFLILFSFIGYSQNPLRAQYGIQITGGQPTVTDDPYVTTTGATGIQGKIAPVNLLIPYTPVNYSVPNLTIGAHLGGIDTRLNQISSTTAGITQRVYFTADNTTVNSVVYFASSLSGKGSTASGSPPALVLADNTKAYFTKDIISIAQPSPTIGYAGTYSGNLTVSATPTPVATQQRFTVEIYRTDNLGNPIASGVSGAPTGDLGVTVLAILDSGIINLSAGSITNVPVSGILTQNITLNTGERLRYHVSAAKVGSGGGNVTFGVYYGNAYNSYYDIPVAIRSNAVLDDSDVPGAVTVTDALNTLNTNKLDKTTSANIVYGTDGLGAQLNYTSEILENKQSLRDFYNNLYNYSQTPASTFIGISAWGDSVSPETYIPFILSLKSRYQISSHLYPQNGGGGIPSAVFVSSTGTIFDSETAVVDQSVYDGTGGFADFTYLPSGNHKDMSNSSTITISTGQATAFATARAYFASGPGMGSAFVELLDEAGTTVINSTTVNLSGASLNVAKAQFTVNPALKYRLRVTATGRVIYLVAGFFKSNGMIPFLLGRGSSTLAQNNYSNKTILNYFISEFNISLIFLQAKEENISVNLPPTMTTFNTLTTCSKIVVGSAPDSSTISTQISNNLLFRSQALSNDMCYFDGYRTVKNFTEMTRLGWNEDTIHLNYRGGSYLGTVLQSSMGFFNQIDAVEKKPVDNMSNNGYVNTNIFRLQKGDNSGSASDIIVNAGGGVPWGANLRNIRSVSFGDFSTNPVIMSGYDVNTVGVYNNIRTELRDLRLRRIYSESGVNYINALPTNTVGGDVVVRRSGNGDSESLPITYFAPNTLTGYTSGAGTVLATDTVQQAIQKLNGNDLITLNGSAVLDFPSTAAGSSSELTITVTGAAEGDVVALGITNSAVLSNSCYTARVSAANTVTVIFNNYSSSSADPGSGTFKPKVFKN